MMITVRKDSDNMMSVVKLMVVFMVNSAMVKVVIKGVDEQFISQQPDFGRVYVYVWCV